MKRYASILQSIQDFGKHSPLVDALVMIGSYAREKVPADEFSDLDLILFVKDPNAFLFSDHWLEGLGPYTISFVENTVGGLRERRMLFEGCLDVDFIFIPPDFPIREEFAGILKRGYRILLDKTGIGNTLEKLAKHLPVNDLPSREELITSTNDFWYHAVWTAKKILRGELWTAKNCMDCYMKNILLRFIELYTVVCTDESRDTWHNGRMIEKWADPVVLQKIPGIFSEYDREQMIEALFHMMELFRFLSIPIAEKLSYLFPHKAEEFALQWITQAFQE